MVTTAQRKQVNLMDLLLSPRNDGCFNTRRDMNFKVVMTETIVSLEDKHV